jgi:hypothetical protein
VLKKKYLKGKTFVSGREEERGFTLLVEANGSRGVGLWSLMDLRLGSGKIFGLAKYLSW